VKEQRSLLKSQLRPSSDATPEQRQAYTNSLEQFDNYVEKNGQEFDRKELQTYTESLIKQRKTTQIQDARNGLAMPTHTSVGREAMTLEEVHATRIKLLGELRAGNITREEAGKQWQLLKQWQKMLETSGEKGKLAIPSRTRGVSASETVPQSEPVKESQTPAIPSFTGGVDISQVVQSAPPEMIQQITQQLASNIDLSQIPPELVQQIVQQVISGMASQVVGGAK
jgi:hypothetical protein